MFRWNTQHTRYQLLILNKEVYTLKIKFTHIELENFCGIKSLSADLHKNTIIKGKNGVGKSTIRNAISWILYNKLADGSTGDKGIRPHDKDGVDIDFVDIVGKLTMVADGKEIVIKKTSKQKWTTPRGTTEKRFDGNINEYEINDIPKKLKDFEDYINKIVPRETFMYCTNPNVFLSLDTKKRREILFKLVSKITDKEVIKKNPQFKELENDLEDGNILELIARSRKIISAKNEELDKIPVRVDEIEKQKVDVDVAAIEKQIEELKAECIELDKHKSVLEKHLSESEKHLDEILEVKFEMNGLEQIEKDKLIQKKRAIENIVVDSERQLQSIKADISRKEVEIEWKKEQNDKLRVLIDKLNDDLKNAQNRAFDEESTICPTCKRKLEESQIMTVKEHFETNKANKISKIETEIESSEKNLKSTESEIKEIESDIKLAKSKYKEVEKKYNKDKGKLDTFVEDVDMTSSKQYQKLAEKLKELESNAKDCSAKRIEGQELRDKILEKQTKISWLKDSMNVAELNNKIDERIEELRQMQVENAQVIANETRKLDLLQEYNRTKIKMLTDSINEYFDVVKWVMFQQQINGAYAEVCIPTVDGTSYDGLLNHGAKILTEIDICMAFQKANKVELPICIDDTESLDSDKLPKLNNQLIALRRTDDEKLTIEGVE